MQGEFCSGSSRRRSARSVGRMGMVNGVMCRFANRYEPESLLPTFFYQSVSSEDLSGHHNKSRGTER